MRCAWTLGTIALCAACGGDAWQFRPLDAGPSVSDRGTTPDIAAEDTAVRVDAVDVVSVEVATVDVVDAGGLPADSGSGSRCRFDTAPCDPVRNTGCSGGQVCYPFPSRPACDAPVSAPGWDQPCATSGIACAPGFRCCSSCGRVCKRVCCAGEDGVCQDTASGGRAGARCTGAVFSDVGNCE